MTCLIGIHLACLQLGCDAKPVQLDLGIEEPVAMAEQPEASKPDPSFDADDVPADDTAPRNGAAGSNDVAPSTDASGAADRKSSKVAVATFGAGCFWCTEAVFLRLKGVTAVESGYAGGFVKNPTYEAVCAGETGHAEVCRITFNPDEISFDELLKVFWKTHDPTTLNQQGADRGTQYRSVVFHHDDAQKEIARKYKQELDKSGAFPSPIVTEISPLREYYKAEEYHQNYFERNPYQGYCQAVVRPKVEKLEKVFRDKLKSSPK